MNAWLFITTVKLLLVEFVEKAFPIKARKDQPN